MQESILCTFVKIWLFYPKFKLFSYFGNDYISQRYKSLFSKTRLKCKNILQTVKETFTKSECKSDSKTIKKYP